MRKEPGMRKGAGLAPLIRKMAEGLVFLLSDLLGISLMLWLAIRLRVEVLPGVYHGFSRIEGVSELNIYLVFIAWLFFIFYEGLYTNRFSIWDEVFALLKVSVYATLGVFVVGSLGKMSLEVSRPVVVLTGLLSLAVMPTLRLTLKAVLRRAGLFTRRVLILGAGETGRIISSALREEANYGYEIVGFLDDDPEKIGTYIDGAKVHRGIDLAERYIERCGISDVFVAMPGAGSERMREIVNRLQHVVERLFVIPDIFGMAVTGTRLMHFFRAQAFAFEMKNNLASPLNNTIKRIVDLMACAVLVPLLALPMLAIAALVRRGSGGPAMLRQERIGRHGGNFTCLKFRTMYEDADERLAGILVSDPEAKKEWEAYKKLKNDPRVTGMGRFLRSTSLDELPQVFNVLMGQMSLVGPRPYLPREWDELREYSDTILSVRPGITGLWQVSGRSGTTFEVRLSLDAWYVRNWNLWLDFIVLLKTVSIVLRREGAR